MTVFISNFSKIINLRHFFVVLMLVVFGSCRPLYTTDYKKPVLVDNKVSRSTKKLHKKLYLSSKKGFAVGQQDATSYGIGWKHGDNPDIVRSDPNDIIGDFPAVYGFDIGHIEHAHKFNLDTVGFATMRKLIIEAHKSGGIITISWHLDNPVSGGDSWDPTPAVSEILENGSQRDLYELWISRVAVFLKSLKYKGSYIPIIFRPYHEMNGAWFWWGESNCTADDYTELWRQTVALLRDKHRLHNLLYAYSPNKLGQEDNYMKYYPGDNYVDILGIDIYDFNNQEDYIQSVVNDLNVVRSIATERNKLYAFTETGLEKIPNQKWFTEVLYPNIENSGISWILFWRNARVDHHYLPYKGHQSADDFKKFGNLPKALFLNDVMTIKP